MIKNIQHFLSRISLFFDKQEKKVCPSTASLIYIILATIVGYGNTLCAKFMVIKYSPLQLSYTVCFVCVLLTYFLRMSNPKLSFSFLKPKEIKFTLIRGFFSMTGQMLCFYYLNKYLPLSLINVIYGFTPVIVFLLDRILYSTALKTTEIVGSFLSFIGIALVIDIFQFGGEETNNSEYFHEVTGMERIKYCLICLLACCGFACSNISMKELHNVNVLVIQFYMYILGVMIMIVGASLQGTKFLVYEFVDFFKVIFINGMLQFSFMLLFTRALQLGKKGRVVVVNNLQLLYSFLVEIFIFHQTPTLIRILGSIILVGGITRAVL